MSDVVDIANDYAEVETSSLISQRVRYEGISNTHCDECDEKIPTARREAIPGCKLCVKCQSKKERR